MRLGLYRKGKDSEKSPRAAQLRQVFLFFRPASPPLRSGQKRAKKIDKEIGSLCLPLALRSPPPFISLRGPPGKHGPHTRKERKKGEGGGGGCLAAGAGGRTGRRHFALALPTDPSAGCLVKLGNFRRGPSSDPPRRGCVANRDEESLMRSIQLSHYGRCRTRDSTASVPALEESSLSHLSFPLCRASLT